MGRKRHLIQGVANITAYANSKLPNFPHAISGDEIRRHLVSGVQVSEPRIDKRAPYEVHQNSFHPVDPNVDIAGFGGIAEACYVSSRQALRLLPKGKIPGEKWYGRWYSCQSSCEAWKK